RATLRARVAGLAKGGQIITTADTVVKLSPLFTELVRKLDRVPVKGKQEEVTIFEFLWQDSEELTTAFGTRPDYRRTARIRLKYEGREWRFEGPGELTLRRARARHHLVGDRQASRPPARPA